ncbi:Fe-S protein assembly co-chaperone HscB [Rodentibacter trehalosifermentans]|uniref:Co-chaperone protein HscB homolog n=1 Tax=Rodentibacter trehalosifermentans TaxID=1908263 RepID=A0A1V3ITN4_9PAST|nr:MULTISPECIES: Fe-S protein assembly co-chaperone HscB [Rodentibacter]OOF36269.1 Fe-S protein assembly co-chaperone HscB [Rodentibacter rarus]OOF45486.1 Fe-S protein assembly co-chaperone HscB [Rodentibacter trehalosifermentans]
MLNPFEIFGLPVDFQLDSQALNARYLELQKALHPDNFVSASALEQRMAMQKSTEVNDALKTLKDPILRAEAIVALNLCEQQDIEQKSTQDVAFLMQQLQWREELETIELEKNEVALSIFEQNVCKVKVEMLKELQTYLSNNEWDNALSLTNKLRFIQKLISEIEKTEELLLEV